ncbi:outer membrane beta-barrel protein [Putridiphycobacter roseus]|nr:outer membrane beta-barrel protein [Putridiphycobacter roseus]
MKQIFLFFIIFNSVSYGQSEQYSLAGHFGYALSNLSQYYSYVQVNKTECKSTYNIGIELRRQIGQKGIYLQSGIRLTGYGWKNSPVYYNWSSTEIIETTNVNTTNLSFVSIPLIATFKFSKIIPGLTISSGPQISLFSFRKWKQNGDVLSSQWSLPDLAFSVFLSLGYEYKISNTWILGTEVYSNLIPKEVYNFGIAFSGRYILK